MGSHIKKGGAPSPKLFEVPALPFVGSLITRHFRIFSSESGTDILASTSE
jgi:hypothetical protein